MQTLAAAWRLRRPHRRAAADDVGAAPRREADDDAGDGVTMVYQPIMELRSRQIVGWQFAVAEFIGGAIMIATPTARSATAVSIGFLLRLMMVWNACTIWQATGTGSMPLCGIAAWRSGVLREPERHRGRGQGSRRDHPGADRRCPGRLRPGRNPD